MPVPSTQEIRRALLEILEGHPRSMTAKEWMMLAEKHLGITVSMQAYERKEFKNRIMGSLEYLTEQHMISKPSRYLYMIMKKGQSVLEGKTAIADETLDDEAVDVADDEAVAVADNAVAVANTDTVDVADDNAVDVADADAVAVEADAVAVADDDAVAVANTDTVDVADDNAVAAVDADAVAVADVDAVVVEDDAVAVADDNAVDVADADAVAVADVDAVVVDDDTVAAVDADAVAVEADAVAVADDDAVAVANTDTVDVADDNAVAAVDADAVAVADVDAVVVEDDAVAVEDDAVAVEDDAIAVADDDAVAVEDDAVDVADADAVDVADDDTVAVEDDAVDVADADAVDVADDDTVAVEDDDAVAVEDDAVAVEDDAIAVADDDTVAVDDDAVDVADNDTTDESYTPEPSDLQASQQNIDTYTDTLNYIDEVEQDMPKDDLPADDFSTTEDFSSAVNHALNIEDVFERHNSELADKVLMRTAGLSQEMFAVFVTDLLSKMGYNAFQTARYTPEAEGSSMIQGVILDPKAKTPIYIHAEKLSPGRTVGRSDMHDFADELAEKGGTGIFATTGEFSEQAGIYAQDERIMLIDGKKLAGLMLANNFCVNVAKVFEVKELDEDSFSEYE